MRTRDVLDALVKTGKTEDWFKQPISRDEAKIVRYSVHKFTREFCIYLTHRDTVGYYVPVQKDRLIQGLFPLTVKELLLMVSYSTCIIFSNPRIELTVDFLGTLAPYYGLEEKTVEAFIEELVEK